MASIQIDLKGVNGIQRNLRGRLLDGVLTRIVTKTAIAGENEGKKRSPVDTGRLRASMTHRVTGTSGWFGTNVHYGRYLDQPKTRRPRYRGGPMSGASTAGWLTKHALESTAALVPKFVADEVRVIETRWRT